MSLWFKMSPEKGEIYAQAAFSRPAGIINVNTADKELLVALPGIGPKTAERIIRHRRKQGKFSDISQLKQIKGIGEKKLEQIRRFLTVD